MILSSMWTSVLVLAMAVNFEAAVPLGCYLIAPAKTRALLGIFQDWIRARRRRDFAVLLAIAGCIMIALGITGR